MEQESTFDVVTVGARKASGWGTARAKTLEGDTVKLVGQGVGRLNPGDRIQALYTEVNHSTYGDQLQIQQYELVPTEEHWGLIE